MLLLSSLGIIAILSTNVAATQLGPADLSISIVSASKKFAKPGEWVSFTIRITNANSNNDGWVNLTLSGGTTHTDTGKNWRSILEKETNIVVRYSSSTDVRLDVRVGAETFNSSSEAGHVERVVINGEYYDKGDQTYAVAGTLYQTADVEVLQKHQFEFGKKTGETDPKRPNQARQVQFNFTINNTGNGEDLFTFKVENAPGTPFITTTNVPAYSSKDVQLTINNIPKDTEAGIHFVTVKAYSSNSTVAERQAGVNVQVDPTYNLDLSTTEPTTKSILPNQIAYYNFTIENKGNDEDQVILSYGFNNPAPFWDVSVSWEIKTIQRNSTTTLRVDVEAPANATYPTSPTVFINISSKNDPNVYQYLGSIKTKIIQKMDVDIIPIETQLTIDSSYKASFPIDVYNKGNGEDTFELSLYGKFPVGELWNYNFNPPSVTLGPEGAANDNQRVYFNVTGPEDAKFGSFKVKVNATSKKDSSKMDQKELTISVGKFYNIDITRLASEKQSVYPGDSISIRIRGENTGNFMDTFNLDVDVPSGAVSWTPEFEPDIFLDLAPNEIDYSYFNLTVDENAPQGNYLFTIKCISKGDPLQISTVDLNVSVKRKYEIELTVDTTTKSANPGDAANFMFTVQNKGTGSCNVTMESTMSPQYETYMSVVFSPASFELVQASSNKIVWVNITPSPSNPLAPMNLTGIPITVNADITEKEGGIDVSKDIKVKINQTYGVDVYSETLYINPEPGTSVSFNITITNKGNGEDSFGVIIPAVRTGWTVKPSSPNTAKLQQNDEERILITVTIPSTEKHISENITINVSSRGDSVEYQTEIVTVNVDITRGIRFAESDNRKEGEPGSFVLFDIKLENTGTIEDTYTLEVGDVEEFVDYSLIDSLSIGPNTKKTAVLNITISDTDVETLPSMTNVTVTARSVNSSVVTASKTFTIDITAVRGVRLSPSPSWQKGQPKDKIKYNVTIENTGTGDDRFALTILSNPPYSGWARILNFGDYTENLGPGDITYVDVEVEIPANQEPGEGKILLKAESKANTDKTHTVNFTFTIEQIFRLQVTIEPSTQTVDPGENATYTVRIKNTGTGIDNVSITYDVVEHPESVFTGLFTYDYVTLSPGQTKTITFIAAAVKEPQEGELLPKIDIEATSEEDTADPAASDTERITLEINPTVDIELQADKLKKDITPNLSGTKAEVEYTVTIWNRGLDKDSFDITENNDHGFIVELTPTTTSKINSGDSAAVTVKIIIDNKAAMTASDYTTTLTVTSRTNTDKSEDIDLKTRIKQAFGVELQPLDNRLETEDTLTGDNRIVEFQVEVENIGTGDDTYKLEFTGDYANWATLDQTSYLPIGSKQKQVMKVTVKIPRETEQGDIAIVLKATSRGDDTLYDEDEDAFDEVTLTVEVTQFYELTLTSTESTTKSGLPGDTVDFTITVSNRGNGEDDVQLQKEDYDINWDWTLSSSRFSLTATGDTAGGDTRDITLSIDIPTDKDGKSGTYDISIIISSVNTPEGKITHNNNDPLQFTVKVDEQYDVELNLDYPTSSSEEQQDPGRSIDYQVTVKNKGNTVDTFSIEVSGAKSDWVDLETNSLIIAPYKSKKLNFTVDIPDLDDVEPKDVEADRYTITIKVTSDGDQDQTDEIDIHPTVESEYKITLDYPELELNANNEGVITVDPQGDPNYKKFTLDVTNDGNDLDSVSFTSSKPDDWIVEFDNVQTKTLNVQIGVTNKVSVKITPPDDAKDGETGRITITAKSKDQKTKTQFSIRATVETPVVKFSDLKISGDKTEGSKVTISLTVKNDGNVDAEDVRIKFTDNNEVIKEETIKLLGAGTEKDISFTYKVDAGDHEIQAETVDEWSGVTQEEQEAFSSTSELLPGNMLYIIMAIALVVVFIIGIIIASVSYSRGIPQDLKEEIAMSKQAARMGKSPEEIKEMRRKRLERGGGEKKRGGLGPAMTDKEPMGGDEEERPKAPSKAVRIKCPKCDKIQTVPSSKRPIEFGCSNCGMKLVLKK
jgi:uncharacterized membrane protein/ribosomal protein S27E